MGGNQPVRLCRGEGVTEYFRELVEDAVGRQHIAVDQMTSYYVVQMLSAFARQETAPTDAGLTDTPLALRLGQALETGGSRQRALLRQVGDAALFVSGFFPDSLKRSLVDVDYYIRLGGYAYGSLSLDAADRFSTVFAELAEHFAEFVDVLGEVSEKSAMTSTTDLLRLYERWVRTGNARCADHLLRQGVIPTPATSRLVQ